MVGVWITLALLTLAATGLAVLWFKKSQEAQREAFEALAARRGWSLHITTQSLGRPALLRLSARGGPQWTARSLAVPGDTTGASQSRMTEYTGEEPRWSQGTLFIGPSAPLSQSPDGPHPASPAQQETWIRDYIIGDGMGADLSGLAPISGPGHLSIHASADPKLRVDIAEMGKLWAAWQPMGPKQALPIVMLGPNGMRVRLWHATKSADQLERLIDFAFTVSRTIGDR